MADEPDLIPLFSADELPRLRAESELLRAALKPFADSWEAVKADATAGDGMMLMYASNGGDTFLGFATVGDLRRAHAACHPEQRVTETK